MKVFIKLLSLLLDKNLISNFKNLKIECLILLEILNKSKNINRVNILYQEKIILYHIFRHKIKFVYMGVGMDNFKLEVNNSYGFFQVIGNGRDIQVFPEEDIQVLLLMTIEQMEF
jgi:hypothetical protein